MCEDESDEDDLTEEEDDDLIERPCVEFVLTLRYGPEETERREIITGCCRNMEGVTLTRDAMTFILYELNKSFMEHGIYINSDRDVTANIEVYEATDLFERTEEVNEDGKELVRPLGAVCSERLACETDDDLRTVFAHVSRNNLVNCGPAGGGRITGR